MLGMETHSQKPIYHLLTAVLRYNMCCYYFLEFLMQFVRVNIFESTSEFVQFERNF